MSENGKASSQNGVSTTAHGLTVIESAVRERYASASQEHEACLCVPSQGYDPKYLKVIPPEIIERDYGCGDPSKWVEEGETVLDLGSGGGKVCFICAQKVGAKGRVIGVDFNQPMLELARKYQSPIGDAVGFQNTSFRKGKIQDLALDLDVLDGWLKEHPVRGADGYLQAQDEANRLRRAQPMIADDSVDVVVSNCVLNLVRNSDRVQLFAEMFRVLKPGGRCVISDIVADEDVPQELQNDPELWSGCISGAFREDLFIKAFDDAGFHGMMIVERSESPWQTVKGIEFRSVTVQAFKGKQGPCLERNQSVIYKGPWRKVIDDDGHTLERGQRMAICDKNFKVYSRLPYREQFYFVEPAEPIAIEEAKPFDCRKNAIRAARETKGKHFNLTTAANGDCCGPDGCV